MVCLAILTAYARFTSPAQVLESIIVHGFQPGAHKLAIKLSLLASAQDGDSQLAAAAHAKEGDKDEFDGIGAEAEAEITCQVESHFTVSGHVDEALWTASLSVPLSLVQVLCLRGFANVRKGCRVG